MNFSSGRTLPTQSTGPQTPFLTDISVSVAQIKKFKKQGGFIFEFCFWEDPPHPVNWSPTHSTGPQTPFFTYISVSVAQIKKNNKNRCIFLLNFASGGTLPTQSTGSQPIQLVPRHRFFYRYLDIGRSNNFFLQKTRWFYFRILLLGGPSPPSQLVPNPFNWSPNTFFYRYLAIGRSNQKISKNKVHFFSNFASGRTLPTQSTDPQPIQLVPKHRFFYRYFLFRL